MTRFRKASRLDAPRARVWEWHASPGALGRLLPPWQDVRLVSRDPELEEGSRAELELRFGPFRKRWVAVHRDVVPGHGFVDEQVSGPFRSWRHTHRFEDAPGGGTELVDEVSYQLPLPPIGPALARGFTDDSLERMFAWRHERTRRDLERHGRFPDERLRIAITGASGLLGRELRPFLEGGGHRVDPLVRRPAREGTTEIEWRPDEPWIDAPRMEGVDAVVHLAGESLLAARWTSEKKQRIRTSRVEGTELVARTLAGLERRPRVLVSASAIGFYGNRGDEALDETSSQGDGFLAEVCADWEAATRPAEEAGIRVVRLRIGVVLTPRGGALRTMLPAFRSGLGGPLGNPGSWLSWVGLDDLVGIIHHALLDDDVRGPVNAVAPQPVTQRELARAMGEVLRRPTVLCVPEFALRGLAGEMADEALLASTRVLPARLEESAFPFLSRDLRSALRWELGLRAEREAGAG